MVIHLWAFGRYFLKKKNEISLSHQGNQVTVFVANDNFQLFKQERAPYKYGVCFIIFPTLLFPTSIPMEGQKTTTFN